MIRQGLAALVLASAMTGCISQQGTETRPGTSSVTHATSELEDTLRSRLDSRLQIYAHFPSTGRLTQLDGTLSEIAYDDAGTMTQLIRANDGNMVLYVLPAQTTTDDNNAFPYLQGCTLSAPYLTFARFMSTAAANVARDSDRRALTLNCLSSDGVVAYELTDAGLRAGKEGNLDFMIRLGYDLVSAQSAASTGDAGTQITVPELIERYCTAMNASTSGKYVHVSFNAFSE